MIENDIFDGKYRIKKVLGQGGMGKVYLAENIKLGNYWAIKEIKKENDEKYDLLAEPNMLKKLKHPALPRIFDILENESAIYIIEDYVEGESLDKQLMRVETFSEKTVIDWAKQICDVLLYLHNSKPNPIIYRDLKPSNIMVNDENEIKIIDFGIAREYKEEAEGDTTYIGTRGYAAPEQLGTAQSDVRTDIYSLGVTLYHLITGKGPNEPPFEILPVRKLNNKLSRGIEYIILKCTEQDPNKRYQSVNELFDDLNNIHKFSEAYKKHKIIQSIKIVIFFALISGFSYVTYLGYLQLDVEKNERYVQLINSGKDYLSNENYDKAVEVFNSAVEEIPERPEAYKEMAEMYFEKKDYDKCIDYITHEVFPFVESSLSDADTLYILGTCYFEKKDYNNTILYLEKTKKLVPNNVVYQRDLAVSYARTGDIEKAKNILEFINNNGIDEEVSWYVNGEILAADKQFEQALSSFEKCISISKDEIVKRKAFISSAQVLEDNVIEIKDANIRLISILERAKSELKEKNDIVIIEMLGKAYYNAAAYDEENKNEYMSNAIANFEQLISLGYNRPYIYKNIAGIYKQINDFSKCEDNLLKMKELYPEDYTCYEQLAFLYAEIENKKTNKERNYEKTLENYELAIKYSPDGEETVELKPLIKLIEDLRKGNWIDK